MMGDPMMGGMDPMMGGMDPMMGDPMAGAAPMPPGGGEADPASMALAAAEVTLEMLRMLPNQALQALAGAAMSELETREQPAMGGADPMMGGMPPPAMGGADPMMGGADPMMGGMPPPAMGGGIGALVG